MRAMSTPDPSPPPVLSATPARAMPRAVIDYAFQFPHRPLDNPVMLATGLAILGVAVALFATTSSMMKQPATQSFEK